MTDAMARQCLKLPAPPSKRRKVVHVPSAAAGPTADTTAPLAARGEEQDVGAEPQAPQSLPNDVLVALQLLNSRFPPEAKVAPFATRAQLYSVLSDRTAADRQLEQLRRSNTVRLMQLPAGKDELAIMLTSDYCAALRRIKTELLAAADAQQTVQQERELSCGTGGAGGGQQSRAAEVLDWFAERVLPACTALMITHAELVQLLAGGRAAAGASQRGGARAGAASSAGASSAPAAVSEAHISLMLSRGLLTRNAASADSYLFSMPDAGAALHSVPAGRQEVLSLLLRRRHPELLEAELAKRKLQRSVLGTRWHVADMLGSGVLLRIPTTVGPLLRVARRGG